MGSPCAYPEFTSVSTADTKEVVPLRAFKDNYIWTLRSAGSIAVVDPGEAKPVLDYIERTGHELDAILLTHHHPDHVGGVAALRERFSVPVYGPSGEPIATLTDPVQGGDHVELPRLGARFEVLAIPGHTRAHIAYYGEWNGRRSLFCGDTLFACGCGRVFEGTTDQMYASLSRLAALPDDTLVYCGHEYTLANIDFASTVEPDNASLRQCREYDASLRARDQPTLPSTIGRERRTNPFLRCMEPAVVASANKYMGARLATPGQVFAALRDWKNKF
jgi:hydroxyacylglutathione hydrolase